MTKILLVEDDKSLREIYGVRLYSEGYDIISAGDGEEALAMAIKERPQLILSDVMMPKISGFDMLDILRSTTETKDIKVIMMTALSSEDQRQRGEQLGADRYLVKSQVGIEDVVRTVHEVLGDAPTNNTASPAGQPSFQSQPTAAATPTADSANTASATPTAVPPRPAPAPASAATSNPPAPASPQPAATAELPKPTAPFSTPRPSNLGDRVIQPLQSSTADDSQPDLSAQMEQELASALGNITPNPAPPSSDQPASPSSPEPSSQSTPPATAPPQPQPEPATTTPQPEPNPVVATAPTVAPTPPEASPEPAPTTPQPEPAASQAVSPAEPTPPPAEPAPTPSQPSTASVSPNIQQ